MKFFDENYSQEIPTRIKCLRKKYNLKQSDLGNAGQVSQVEKGEIWKNLYLLFFVFCFFVSFMSYATGIVSSHFMNHTAQLFYGLIVIVSTVANWFLHKVIDKPNIDQKELLEATVQYRKLLIPDLIIKGVGLILSLILYPPIMMYSVLIVAFYIITLKTLSEKRVNN